MGASDYSVGNAPQGASYAAPLVGFALGQQIADLPAAYMQGREMKRARAMQDMFAGGLPQHEDGSTNWTAALQKYLQEGSKIGGGQFVGQYVPQLLDEEQARNAYAISRGEPIGPSAFFGGPQGQANASAGPPGNIQPPPQAQGTPQGQPQPPAAQPQQSGPRFRQLAASYHLDKDAIDSLGRVLKIDPEKALSPQQVVAVRRAIEEELPKPTRIASAEDAGADDTGGTPPFAPGFKPPTGGGTSPAPIGGRAPNAVAQAGGGAANVDAAGGGGLRPTPVGTEAEARQKELESKRKSDAAVYVSKRNPTLSKDLMEQSQSALKRAAEIRASLGEYNKPTGEMMNAEASGFKSPAEAKAAAKYTEDVAAAKGKRVADAMGAIKPAREALNVINEMDNALTSGWNNIATGAGARQWLEVKKSVNNIFPGTFSNVSQAETIDKLNAQLAAAAAKAMTARPSQLEFRAFMSNNPGLLTSRETSRNLLDIMRQAKQQELELGQIAGKLKPGEDYADVEEKFYRSHPIISPFTHKPIDAKKAADGKWYRPDPDRPGKYITER